MKALKYHVQRIARHTKHSIIFPSFVGGIFLILVVFGISGSSATIYGQLLNGPSYKDHNLLVGAPRAIRSDEWTVTTQMVIAQSAEGYPSVNQNIGKGQNMNLIIDVPSRDWSQIFRPQNWAFLILPLENAFAYKWWFHAVILLLVVYFFTLHFIPKKYLLASFVAIAITFSGFLQWWYGSTLSMLAYILLIGLLYMSHIEAKRIQHKVITTLGIVYAALCFGVMLYPPFQIPCALVLIGFIVGYSIYRFTWKQFLVFLKKSWPFFVGALASVAILFGLFMYDNRVVITTVQNTTYPGKRIVNSGGYSITHLFSGSLAVLQLRTSRAAYYQDTAAGATNQSESSSFIFTSAFLVLPLFYIYFKEKQNTLRKRYVYIAISLMSIGAILLAWLYVPGLSFMGDVLKLSEVPQNRAIMGLGLLNIVFLIIFIWIYRNSNLKINKKKAIIYSLCVFLFTTLIHLKIHSSMPNFVGAPLAILLALPVSVTVFLLLRKHFTLALGLLATFTFLSSALVNPLYQGLSVMTNNPLITAIKSTADDGTYWIAENIYLENIAAMAGRHSLSGVYAYPQLSIWQPIDNGLNSSRYNRYAHVSFNFDKNPALTIPTGFVDSGPDQLVIKTEVCSAFLKSSKVTHIISTAIYSPKDQPCISSVQSVQMGSNNYYIYSLK